MRGKAMTRDRSEEPRSEEIAEEWCCAIPAISKSSREDVARHGTDRARVGEVWDRYREQVMHLPGVVEFRRTRLAIWAEATAQERADTSQPRRDHALYVGVLDNGHQPSGPLLLEGVPLVVRVTGKPRRVNRRTGRGNQLRDSLGPSSV